MHQLGLPHALGPRRRSCDGPAGDSLNGPGFDLDASRLTAAVASVDLVRRIVILEQTGSTNDDARRLAAEGAVEGTVVIAGAQLSGRGRLGRSWDSPDRLGLYLSLLLRPREPLEGIGRYPIACAVAVCAACREIAGESVLLKWPNDVLAGSAKLAGVLCEMRQGPTGVELVVGVGINCNQARGDFPEGLRDTATSLQILRDGRAVPRETVALILLTALGGTINRLRREGWPWVSERFLRYAPDASGRRVRLTAGGDGLTRGLDPTGALRVETADGIALVHASESVAVIED